MELPRPAPGVALRLRPLHEPAGLLPIAGDTREAVPAGSGGGTAAEATSHEPAASAPDAKTDTAGPVVTPAPPRQPACSGATQPAPGSASAEESSLRYIALSIGYECEKYEKLKTIFPNFLEIVVNVRDMIVAPPKSRRLSRLSHNESSEVFGRVQRSSQKV